MDEEIQVGLRQFRGCVEDFFGGLMSFTVFKRTPWFCYCYALVYFFALDIYEDLTQKETC